MKRFLLASTILVGTAVAAPAMQLGAYVGIPGYNDADSTYAAVKKALGDNIPTVLNEYVDSNGDMSTWPGSAAWSANLLAKSAYANVSIPSIGIPMSVVGHSAKADFQAIASGSQDSAINGIFAAYVNAGFPNFYIRPGWEMNGNWEPWSVTSDNAAAFNAAFQRIAQLAHAYPSAKIQTVWNPAAGGGWGGPIATSSYYPGDAAVDIIGMDQYGTDAGGAPENAPFDTTSDPTQFTLHDALQMAQDKGKPFALPEVGAGANDTTFPGYMASVIAQYPKVDIAFVSLWDCVCGGITSLKVTDNDAASNEWNKAFAAMASHRPSSTSPITTDNTKPTTTDHTKPTSSSPPDYSSPVSNIAPSTLAPVDSCNAGQSAGGTAASTLIPGGYLHVDGAKILSDANQTVRIASVGVNGMYGIDNLDQTMTNIIMSGFNTTRLPYYNASIDGDLVQYDKYVAAAGKYGIRVIFDQHADESPSANNGYLPNQPNGLPVDVGPGTDGTDGAGDHGTVDLAKYVSDWAKVAKRYAGNPTVIGFDLHNEPLEYGIGGTVTWGDGGPKDILAMYTAAGKAIQAVNPDALIIAAGPISYHGNYAGTGDAPGGDLSLVGSKPLVLPVTGKVIYTVHEYPAYIGGYMPQSGTDKMKTMSVSWGYLVAKNIAPVWVGEMGASMDPSDGEDVNQTRDWATTMVTYFNGGGTDTGGPAAIDGQGPVHTSWWVYGYLPGEQPNGTLNADNSPKQAQMDVYATFRQRPLACTTTTTPPSALAPTTNTRYSDNSGPLSGTPTASTIDPALLAQQQATLLQAASDIMQAEQVAVQAQAGTTTNNTQLQTLLNKADADLKAAQALVPK